MSKQERRTDGRLTYLHEKLGQAIDAALFADTPERIAGVFEILSRVDDIDPKKSPYLKDVNAKRWFGRIMELIKPSPEDELHPDAGLRGTFWVRAKRMTTEEKSELASSMTELHAHVGWIDGA